MMQLGDEHRGYAVECGTSLFVDGRKYHERVEALYHDLRTAVSEAVHRGENHAEAVEQGQQQSLSSEVNFMCSPVRKPLLAML